jgi:hypothetical protein
MKKRKSSNLPSLDDADFVDKFESMLYSKEPVSRNSEWIKKARAETSRYWTEMAKSLAEELLIEGREKSLFAPEPVELQKNFLPRIQSLYNEVRRAGSRGMSIASELTAELQNKARSLLAVLDFDQTVAAPSRSFRGQSSLRLDRLRKPEGDVEKSADGTSSGEADGSIDFSRVEWSAFFEDSASTGTSRRQSIVLLPSIEVDDDVDLPELLVLVDGMPTGEGYAYDPGIASGDGEFVVTLDGLPPVLAFLAVTLDDGTVVVNFRAAPLDDEDVT